uniref:AlNc14C11G1395 protein n=1 Tax=Albugo laibachii Nc14 TaxID=890382 RepID=F0W316_9STRA|nr:AlNc14C11G1395 [Albugo laibachii Nc14]|eukprot:CCA15453.1 AlNc14C11G1395 [Albugo laibachii Nc14]
MDMCCKIVLLIIQCTSDELNCDIGPVISYFLHRSKTYSMDPVECLWKLFNDKFDYVKASQGALVRCYRVTLVACSMLRCLWRSRRSAFRAFGLIVRF